MDPNNTAHWMWDFRVFINELEINFGPHDPVGDAEKALTDFTMKDNSRILKYNVEFWCLASKLDWNESALRACYYRGVTASTLYRSLTRRKTDYTCRTPIQGTRCR